MQKRSKILIKRPPPVAEFKKTAFKNRNWDRWHIPLSILRKCNINVGDEFEVYISIDSAWLNFGRRRVSTNGQINIKKNDARKLEFKARKSKSPLIDVIIRLCYPTRIHLKHHKSVTERQKRLHRLREAPRMPQKEIVNKEIFVRNKDVIDEVIYLAKGVCGKCRQLAPFKRSSDGTPYLEVHHIVPLANNGEDTVENAIALCPNCHREAHFG